VHWGASAEYNSNPLGSGCDHDVDHDDDDMLKAYRKVIIQTTTIVIKQQAKPNTMLVIGAF
jgi:hypothetical protein